MRMLFEKAKDFLKPAAFILFVAVFFMMVIPPEKWWNSPFYDRFDIYIRIGVVAVVLVLFVIGLIRKQSMDLFVLLCSLYFLCTVVSTWLAGGDMKSAIWTDAIIPLAVVLVTVVFSRYAPREYVWTVYAAYSVILFINLYSVWKNPGVSRSELWFLARNRNSFIFYFFLPLLCGYYGLQKGYLHSRIVYGVLILAMAMTIRLVGGLTATFVLSIWVLFIIFNHFFSLQSVISIKKVLLVMTVFFIILQCFNGNNNPLISRFLEAAGKDGQMALRGPVWEKARVLFLESPVIGHGVMDYMRKLGNAHPHNIYLHIACKCGIFGIAVMGLSVAALDRLTSQMKDKKMQSFIAAALFCLLLEFQFDMITTNMHFLYLSLLYFFAVNEKESYETDCKR